MAIVVAKITLWCCATLFLYAYVGYPVLVKILALICRREEGVKQDVPVSVTVIVAAHNEGDAIADRLNNIAALDVPIRATVEVIVASDGSTDSTNEIVAAWSDPKVRLLTLPRGGRAMAHNRAAEIARAIFWYLPMRAPLSGPIFFPLFSVIFPTLGWGARWATRVCDGPPYGGRGYGSVLDVRNQIAGVGECCRASYCRKRLLYGRTQTTVQDTAA